MRKPILVIGLILVLALGILAQSKDFPKLTGPYLGQTPPGKRPKIFAPGFVSTKEFSEGSMTFLPDGNTVYFTRSNNNDPVTAKIMVSRKISERWTRPVVAPFSGRHIDFESHISPNSSRMFFNRYNPNNKDIQDGIWLMRKSEEGWSQPVFLGKGMNATSTVDGSVYLTDRSIPYEKQGIIKTRVINNGFAPFEWQEGGVNSPGPGRKAGRHPFISPDESFIIFDSYKKGTDDTGRLFVCFRNEGGTWSEAIDLGDEINFAPVVCATMSPDMKYLFYTCKKDIYWVDAKIIEGLKPEELK